MSLEDWLADKLIERHRPSAREIAALLKICDRDLKKCRTSGLGPDWQLGIAYNAALQAAAAALSAAGYRVRKEGHHYRVIQSLAHTINAESTLIKQLDKFRQKRNISDYERAGMITQTEADAMLSLAKLLRERVEQWIRIHHPELAKEL